MTNTKDLKASENRSFQPSPLILEKLTPRSAHLVAFKHGSSGDPEGTVTEERLERGQDNWTLRAKQVRPAARRVARRCGSG